MTTLRPEIKASPVFDWTNFPEIVTGQFGCHHKQIENYLGHTGAAHHCALANSLFTGTLGFFRFGSLFKAFIINGRPTHKITLTSHDGTWVRFHFSLATDLNPILEKENQIEKRRLSWNMMHSPRDPVRTETLSANTLSTSLTLICSEKLLRRMLGHSLGDTIFSTKVSAGAHLPAIFYSSAGLPPRAVAITNEAIKSSATDSIRFNRLEARLRQLLCLVLREACKASPDNNRSPLNRDQLRRAANAKAFIDSNPTIPVRANDVGLPDLTGPTVMLGSTVG
jgi:hypothetical protein